MSSTSVVGTCAWSTECRRSHRRVLRATEFNDTISGALSHLSRIASFSWKDDLSCMSKHIFCQYGTVYTYQAQLTALLHFNVP